VESYSRAKYGKVANCWLTPGSPGKISKFMSVHLPNQILAHRLAITFRDLFILSEKALSEKIFSETTR
jgi:hypothetical protein